MEEEYKSTREKIMEELEVLIVDIANQSKPGSVQSFNCAIVVEIMEWTNISPYSLIPNRINKLMQVIIDTTVASPDIRNVALYSLLTIKQIFDQPEYGVVDDGK